MKKNIFTVLFLFLCFYAKSQINYYGDIGFNINDPININGNNSNIKILPSTNLQFNLNFRNKKGYYFEIFASPGNLKSTNPNISDVSYYENYGLMIGQFLKFDKMEFVYGTGLYLRNYDENLSTSNQTGNRFGGTGKIMVLTKEYKSIRFGISYRISVDFISNNESTNQIMLGQSSLNFVIFSNLNAFIRELKNRKIERKNK